LEMWRQSVRFLLTNDDGYDAPGLGVLLRAARRVGDCVVVAPRHCASAGGHAITDGGAIAIERTSDAQGCARYVVDGTPADCVRVGLTALADLIGSVDWVLAGVNLGGNLGMDVYYSGTVAAAREAAILGIPAIAVSQYIRKGIEPDWARAQRWAESMIGQIAGQGGRDPIVWNVGLPSLDGDQDLLGVAVCPLSTDPLPVRYVMAEPGPAVGWEARYCGVYGERVHQPGTDVDKAFAGWITVTPLGLDATIAAGQVGLVSPE
jgi:5'-nucleotidase